jgi:hypothetical protein
MGLGVDFDDEHGLPLALIKKNPRGYSAISDAYNFSFPKSRNGT